jgi:hypothetical protein
MGRPPSQPFARDLRNEWNELFQLIRHRRDRHRLRGFLGYLCRLGVVPGAATDAHLKAYLDELGRLGAKRLSRAVAGPSDLHHDGTVLSAGKGLSDNEGGAPPDWFRILVIDQLADASFAIIGVRTTSTQDGPFVKLCHAVLFAFKQTTEGTRNAVASVLKRRKANIGPDLRWMMNLDLYPQADWDVRRYVFSSTGD